MFSKSKDEVLETYRIVKCGNDLLDESTKKEFIGFRTTNVGFEGLIENPERFKKTFGNEVIIERPTLEDIMFYSVRR